VVYPQVGVSHSWLPLPRVGQAILSPAERQSVYDRSPTICRYMASGARSISPGHATAPC